MDEAKITTILMHYGPDKQKLQTIEELSELQAEIARDLNGKGDTFALRCEVADVLVMLTQLMAIYDIDPDELEKVIDFKLERQIGRIEEEKNEE